MRILMAYILLITAMPVFADVYKWIDDKGQVHYGDKPSDVTEMEEMKLDNKASSGVALDDDSRDEKRQRLLDTMQEDRQEKEQQREKNRIEKENRQRRCVYLRDRLRRAQAANGIYRLDKDGNRVFLTDAGRQQSEENLRAQINKNCN